MAWLTDWSKRVKLTVDSTKVDSDLTDFPVALTIVSGTNTESVIMDAVVSGGITDTFTGPNGTPPDSALWTKEGTGSASVTNNKMRLSIAGFSQSVNLKTAGIYYACGDFDAQIDWEAPLGNPSTDDFYSYFAVYTADGTNRCTLYYNWYPSWYFMIHTREYGTNHTEYYDTHTHNPTKLRIKRAGSVWSAYKWDGSNWDTLMSASAYIFSTEPVYFYFGIFNAVNYPAATIDFDNFQVTSDWAYYDYSKKIAVTTDDGVTQCPVEIQQWDMMERKAILWTKVPTIVSGTDTNLYLYYDETKGDNDTYIGNIGDGVARTVWDSNFKGVWHMSQNPSYDVSNVIKDSTSNVNHGTPGGSMISSDLVDGKIGKAIDFDGNDYITIPTHSTLKFGTGDFTIESIFKTPSTDTQSLYSYGDRADSAGWTAYIGANGIGKFIIDDGTTQVVIEDTNNHADNSFHSFSAVMDRSADGAVYIDGVATKTTDISSANLTLDTTDHDDIEIARAWYNTGYTVYYTGIKDEVRISNTARTAAWIKATYYSNWNTLFTYGAEELRPIFLFYGTVLVGGSPAAREVCLYRRSTGELMGITTSSGTNGYFEVGSYYNEYHYVVILPELDEDYNLLSYDRIHPEI